MEEAVGKTPTQQMVQSIPTWPQQLQGEMFFDQTSLQNLFAKLFGLGGFAFLWKSDWVFVWGLSQELSQELTNYLISCLSN